MFVHTRRRKWFGNGNAAFLDYLPVFRGSRRSASGAHTGHRNSTRADTERKVCDAVILNRVETLPQHDVLLW
jgi:hypothetical protein